MATAARLACFIFPFFVTETVFFLQALWSNFHYIFFCNFFLSFSNCRTEESSGFEEWCGCFDLLPKPLALPPCPSIRLLNYVITHLLVEVAFPNCLLRIQVAILCKESSFKPTSAFSMLLSLNMIISNFWFKLRNKCFFLLLGHSWPTVWLLVGIISVLPVSGKRETEEGGKSGAVIDWWSR